MYFRYFFHVEHFEDLKKVYEILAYDVCELAQVSKKSIDQVPDVDNSTPQPTGEGPIFKADNTEIFKSGEAQNDESEPKNTENGATKPKPTGKGPTSILDETKLSENNKDKDDDGQDDTKLSGKVLTKSDMGMMHGSTKLSTCISSYCKNGATCQTEGLGYKCICKPGFVGSTCQYTAEQMKKGFCSFIVLISNYCLPFVINIWHSNLLIS